MNTRTLRGCTLAAAVLASALIATPAQAAPVATETAAGACEVTDGTLQWGLKESFRSYISGTIANGEWEVSDGAEYETPQFIWSSGTGQVDPEAGTGEVSFTGTVSFSGHDGALDLVIANPTVEFEDGGKVALLLDVRSTDIDGEESVDEQQTWFAESASDQPFAPSGDTFEIVELPMVLTNSGASAFAGFYEAGGELDPITVSLELASCGTGDADAEATAAPTAAPTADPTDAAAAPEQRIPWIPIIIGAVALLVIGITGGMLIGGRKRTDTQQAQPESRAEQPGDEQ